MRYLGGKSRIAKQIAAVIDQRRAPDQWVWDAFCGGLSVGMALSVKGPVFCTDSHAALINMYLAVQAGWQPPTEVSREQYVAARSLSDADPLKAFCGFGCSFGGKWFGGYQKGRPANASGGADIPARAAALSLCAAAAMPFVFECVDWLSIEPQPCELLLYLDPPYEGTTGYVATRAFDHAAFRRRAAAWASFTDVFVSEYAFPIGVQVAEFKATAEKRLRAGAPERLYHLPKGSRW